MVHVLKQIHVFVTLATLEIAVKQVLEYFYI